MLDVQPYLKVHRQELVQGIEIRKERIANTIEPGDLLRLKDQLSCWKKELLAIDQGVPAHAKLVAQPLRSYAASQKVQIIILKYKEPEIEKKCLSAIIDNTEWPYSLRVEDTRNQNANFARLWNQYTLESPCDYILIMDSDAFVTEPGWLRTLMSSFQSGFQCRASEQGKEILVPLNVGLVVPVTHATGAHTIQGKYRQDGNSEAFVNHTDQVSGFFFLFKKEMWRDIGGFDERFYLHGQDSEWIDRIIDSRWRMIVRPDVYVDHMVSASIAQASENGEVDLIVEKLHTKGVYDMIRLEKSRGVYTPPGPLGGWWYSGETR